MTSRHGRSLDLLLQESTARITRLSASEALTAAETDGLIIDIRSHGARRLAGFIPGSLSIPRTVLEWRVAIDSPWRNPHLGGLGQRLILICDHGYSSVLAADNLVRLGFSRAGDVVGGFQSWSEMALPITACPHRSPTSDALPGMGPPDRDDA